MTPRADIITNIRGDIITHINIVKTSWEWHAFVLIFYKIYINIIPIDLNLKHGFILTFPLYTSKQEKEEV